ncbi:Gfo/Idh/MocA family protein [Natrinema salifodinae]|uniref:Predicted dehydrogenase n=1 Tax=Natrinema salifodinae TaxID=1202768 RepID=A0A1I0QVF7_9EURY|nr:Gfo/Idh/MocA family oxidoreductase [Natrinema salifodinae]SEW30989.1 Predicted dehydrogenase [Natrinema salifodinae]
MKLGVIGVGAIAQIMHVPYLAELPEADIHAIADPGENVVETFGDRYDVPHRYTESAALIEERADELDGVVVTTPMHTHAEVAVAALDADLHTFVEKPVAVTPEDAQAVVDAAEETDAVCMVGYMKRFDPGFRRFQSEVADLSEIDLVTSVVIPPNVGAVIDENYDIVYADLDEGFIAESNAKRRQQVEAAIGTDDETLARAYEYHLESICHDVNALRSVFGTVEAIDHVDVFKEWKYVTAQLRYEGDRRCLLESGATDRKWYDERIRVDAPEGSASIEFSNAFIRNTPSDVRTKIGTDETTETRYTPSSDEPFKRELGHFLECIDGSVEPRTPPAESKADVELIADLFKASDRGTERTIRR